MNETEMNNEKKSSWEREVIEKLAMAAITEQRRARRWNVFFKTLMFVYLIAVGAMAFYPKFEKELSGSDKDHTAIIDVVGMIAVGEAVNADSVIEGLRDALKDKKTKGVILNINSPGGSPVESAYIFAEIKRLKKKHPDIPIHAVVSDICASGGYYIAAAADNIYVSQASMIGSIGVIMNGFGFVSTMEKLGVDRRLIIAGKHKALMDPFSDVNEAENKHMQTLVNDVHQQFIDAIRLGRGDRLKESEDTFSGLIWTGTQGIKMGLADGFGSVDSVARDIIGTENKLNFTPQEKLLEKLVGKLGASFGQALGLTVNGFSMR
ncbi:MAG: signal peptide peptidase SppA [Methylococcales symbiont of Iophon sp. n. MRB-2018]|nr:MAG: signal peptide peptidase SppA [Methylococcales symbiont of Iophon sp. n. MRB-2018]KAF3979069.1 MAG: signal peptide peptidase SppA [Methylococcales symbiont of Iophon sp. n. MRB-2018]